MSGITISDDTDYKLREAFGSSLKALAAATLLAEEIGGYMGLPESLYDLRREVTALGIEALLSIQEAATSMALED